MRKQAIKAKPASQPINLRVDHAARELIDRAVEIKGTNRSAFIVQAAVAAAQETLLDEAFMPVGRDEFNKYLELFDGPPSAEGLERLRKVKAPWLE